METKLNRFGEYKTKWQSHIHPDNKDFMQIVYYMHIQSGDKNTLYYGLDCNTQRKAIFNITLNEAINLYADKIEPEITEKDFNNWLNSRNQNK